MRSLVVLMGFFSFMALVLAEEAVARIPILGALVRGRSRRGPEALANLLEGLGGTFIKFGQMMSMRADLLPRSYCDALAGLYDNVPPFPSDQARAIVEEELGAPVEELFERFDDAPLAAASFGQVHHVVLGRGPDAGTEAVIKIQRPGLDAQIRTDTRLLLWIGAMLDGTGVLGQIKLQPVFKDFARWTWREINFTQEAKNADRIYEETSWNVKQRIPFVYWAYTTRRLVTLEFLRGMSVSQIIQRFEQGDPSLEDDLKAMGCDRVTLARNIYQNFYLQAFIGKVFHADPHPGNLIVLPGNVIGYVDFGLMGRMTPEGLDEQLAVVEAVARKNMERLFVAILDVLDAPRGLLVTESFDAFEEVADAWLDACDNPGATLAEKSVNNFVSATLDLARAIGLPLALNTVLYYKALMSVDASVLRLTPEMDYNVETTQALRLVKLRELEQYLEPGASLDRSMNLMLMLFKAPDFLGEQLVNYQQSTRRMYRKINQLPVIASQVMRVMAASLAVVAMVLMPLGMGVSGHLPEIITSSEDFHLIEALAPHTPLLVLGAFALWWGARVVHGYSLVKVQRDQP